MGLLRIAVAVATVYDNIVLHLRFEPSYEMRSSLISKMTAFAIVMSIATGLMANEPNDSPEVPADAIRVNLSEGAMTGFVFQNVQDQQKPVPAKVTLASGKKIVDSQVTDENGQFSFANVEPGVYTVVGTASGMVGDQVVEVGTFEATNASFAQMPLEVAPGYDAGMVYDSYGDYPVETFGGGEVVDSCGGYSYGGTCGDSCGGSSCGGGGGGGCGGCGGGRFGRLLPLVGLVGLAGLAGNDDPDPVTPFVMN